MGKRREGREAAVQFLFHRDLNQGVTLDALADFWELRPAGNGVQAFATPIIAGVIEQQKVIDEQIVKYTANYDLHRISAVDRNILRVAIYEMFFRGDIPPIVSINEAIEIAKKFGTEESGRFVNGVLDRVKLELSRPLREAAAGAPDERKAQPAASTGGE